MVEWRARMKETKGGMGTAREGEEQREKEGWRRRRGGRKGGRSGGGWCPRAAAGTVDRFSDAA